MQLVGERVLVPARCGDGHGETVRPLGSTVDEHEPHALFGGTGPLVNLVADDERGTGAVVCSCHSCYPVGAARTVAYLHLIFKRFKKLRQRRRFFDGPSDVIKEQVGLIVRSRSHWNHRAKAGAQVIDHDQRHQGGFPVAFGDLQQASAVPPRPVGV